MGLCSPGPGGTPQPSESHHQLKGTASHKHGHHLEPLGADKGSSQIGVVWRWYV